ncbi:hypothetical protein FVE85_9874 [Porphyridium purpureum]|uniref:Uncharacterized protein n=1 Tax=Porphyridium purpureum TaxID=35688 RepID=A0A5J4YIW1_PORPP|nr:hypothetical protein FVE85_9874 [Porphyridium purpureum]|eukprot:POR5975..scf289_17
MGRRRKGGTSVAPERRCETEAEVVYYNASRDLSEVLRLSEQARAGEIELRERLEEELWRRQKELRFEQHLQKTAQNRAEPSTSCKSAASDARLDSAASRAPLPQTAPQPSPLASRKRRRVVVEDQDDEESED